MAKIPTFTPKTPITRVYKNLAGVDFTSDSSMVQLNRSPNCVNMYKDYKSTLGQAIETRPGFMNLLSLKDEIYGIFFFRTDTLKVLVHSGKNLYLWVDYPASGTQEEMTLLFSDMGEVKSRDFVYNNKLYINDGKNYLFYDGKEIKTVASDAYIPTTTMARNPIGGATTLNPVNLLQPKRKNSFLADGTSKDYTLDTANLDSASVFLMTATVNGVEKKENTDFTVNRGTGVVTFNTAPPKPRYSGSR